MNYITLFQRPHRDGNRLYYNHPYHIAILYSLQAYESSYKTLCHQYLNIKKFDDSKQDDVSFIYILTSKGPKWELCGTPDGTFISPDWLLSTGTI